LKEIKSVPQHFSSKVFIDLVTLIEASAPDSVVGGSDVVKMNPEA
jgi:hypothetical protein